MVADGLVAHNWALDVGGDAPCWDGVTSWRRAYLAVPVPTGGAHLRDKADAARAAGRDLLAVAQRWPSIAGALLVQAERQSERVAMHQLISQIPRADQRIVALLWHLADRWGRVEDVGVVVPLAMGHEAISRLVGGRRPTVSTALGRLAERKLVTRLANGTWLLAPESRALLDGSRLPAPTPEVRLLGVKDCEDPQAEPTGSCRDGACRDGISNLRSSAAARMPSGSSSRLDHAVMAVVAPVDDAPAAAVAVDVVQEAVLDGVHLLDRHLEIHRLEKRLGSATSHRSSVVGDAPAGSMSPRRPSSRRR